MPLLGRTAKYVPQHHTRCYAAILLRNLRLAMEVESSNLPPRRVTAWSTLAAAMPYLLLHQPPAAAAADPGFRRTLTQRLRLAESGDYTALLRTAIENERVCKQHRLDNISDRHDTRQKQLERAAEYAADGALRSAARALRPAGTLPLARGQQPK